MANHNSKNMFSKACVASHAAVLSHVYTKQAELKRMTVEVEMQQAEISSKEADIQNADQTIIELRRELKSLDIENRESELRLQSLNANLQSAKSVFNKREEEFEKWEQNQLQVLASIQEQEEGIVEMLEKEEVNLNRVIAAFLNAPCMKKYKILSEITSKEDAETELRALQICDFDDEQNKQLRTELIANLEKLKEIGSCNVEPAELVKIRKEIVDAESMLNDLVASADDIENTDRLVDQYKRLFESMNCLQCLQTNETNEGTAEGEVAGEGVEVTSPSGDMMRD